MRYASSPPPRSHAPRGPRHATVLIDVDDLLYRRDASVLADLVRSLSGFLHRTVGARLQSGRAYADFSALEDGSLVQRDLYGLGIEPVFVGRSASDLILAMDAAVLLATSDPGVLVVVTGSRSYAPLVRRARTLGRRVLVIAAEPGRDADYDTFSLTDLTAEAPRSTPVERTPRPPREGIAYVAIENATTLRALEVIEEFFGQYDEVYLTPLLRKLTEEMEDVEADPKSLISDLEGYGAVYLERRPGRPHDYTVLLVDDQHPDVKRVRELFEDYDEDDDAAATEDDEAYAEDDDAL
ncbi:MAG: NYN domain-containing protein [Bacteroidetes bacterium]|nr:NYN domain-containing protein [Bacteroidota bacterium]